MEKKALTSILLTVTLFCILNFVSLFATKASAETITLKAVSAWPKNAVEVADDYIPFINAANEFLEKKYPGELKINYLGGPEVVPTMDQPEAIRMGTFDMLFGTAAYYAGIAPAANVGKLSQLDSIEEKQKGADAIFDKIHREKLNAAYLGRLGSEIQFQLYTIKPVKTMSDIKGLRIRTSAMYIDFIKALDAIPSQISPGDVYQALERGVVDGYMWPLFSIRPWGWQEVTKYVVGPPFYKVVHPILVNAKRWDSIPRHLQDAIIVVMVREAAASDERSVENMRKEPEILKQAGLEIVPFSSEDEARYLDMAYSSGWEGQLKMETEYTSQLRKILSR